MLGIRFTLVSSQNQEKQSRKYRSGTLFLSDQDSISLPQQTDTVSFYYLLYPHGNEPYILISVAKYPIFPSFAEWRFPQSLPLSWQNYAIPPSPDTRPFVGLQAQLQERDRSCRITLHEDECKVAHLVPRAEAAWFDSNMMDEYVNPGDLRAIDHHGNAILLRADLHHLMDQRTWVPMLKENRFVACTICKPPSQPLSSQFRHLYHNVALQELRGVSKECMFARIAWAAIPLVRQFLQLRQIRWHEKTAVFDNNERVEELTGAQIEAKYNFESSSQSRSGSRRASSTQRAWSDLETATPSAEADTAENGYDIRFCSWNSFDSAYDESSDCEVCQANEDSPPRGRKRQRMEETEGDHIETEEDNN